MERTKVSPELYRAFEECFPQVKSLTEEIQESYNKAFEELDLIKWTEEVVKNNSICRKIGDIKLSPPYQNLPLSAVSNDLPILPALKFWKDNGKANPSFYLITSIMGEILYIGTSEKTDDDSILSQSVSAVTGGILPITETKQAYSLYLGLMCAVKRYQKCYVYEISTGLEDIKITDQYSNDITKEVKSASAKVIYKKLLNAYKDEHGKLPPLNAGVPLFASIHKIWKCVSAFKTMVENGFVKIEEKEGKQTIATIPTKQAITIIPTGYGLKIGFSKKVKFENDYSPLSDNFVVSHIKQASKLMKNEKFWDQVEKSASTLDHDKVNEYFKNQYKEYPVPGEDTRVPIIREATSTKQREFEKKIREIFAKPLSITYFNIFGAEASSMLIDNGDSSIEIYGKCGNPSFSEMQEIIKSVTDAFGIDDVEIRISTEAVESALGNK